MPSYTTDAITIAKWFVDRANNEFVDDNGVTEGITNLKLQKLLYFAQAVSLSLKNKPLFNDKIEAWKFGPVVPVVYDQFKKFENNPITIGSSPEIKNIVPEAIALLEDIWNLYGKFSAHELVNISHDHLPWKKVYNSSDSLSNKEITQESIKEYYVGYYSAA